MLGNIPNPQLYSATPLNLTEFGTPDHFQFVMVIIILNSLLQTNVHIHVKKIYIYIIQSKKKEEKAEATHK